jgi:hypothetical protein
MSLNRFHEVEKYSFVRVVYKRHCETFGAKPTSSANLMDIFVHTRWHIEVNHLERQRKLGICLFGPGYTRKNLTTCQQDVFATGL